MTEPNRRMTSYCKNCGGVNRDARLTPKLSIQYKGRPPAESVHVIPKCAGCRAVEMGLLPSHTHGQR